MLDGLAGEVFGDARPGRDPATTELSQELVTNNGSATLRLAVPFAERGDIEPEEDRARGDRARGRPEADDHAAAGDVRLRAARRALRGRRAARSCSRRAAMEPTDEPRPNGEPRPRPRRALRDARRDAPDGAARARGPGEEPDPRVPADAALADRLVPGAPGRASRTSPRSRTSRSTSPSLAGPYREARAGWPPASLEDQAFQRRAHLLRVAARDVAERRRGRGGGRRGAVPRPGCRRSGASGHRPPSRRCCSAEVL